MSWLYNHIDQLDGYRLSKYNWSNDKEIERMRRLYVEKGLTCAEVAKIIGKGRSTIQRSLSKLGVIKEKG